MGPRVIVIDGKTYNNVNEMPVEIRKRYEQALRTLRDQDGNQVPDAFENSNTLDDGDRNGIPDLIEQSDSAPVVASTIKVLVDGREYNSLNDLPPEARAKYDQAMGALDANRNGVPDFMEGMMGMTQEAAPRTAPRPSDSPRRPRLAPSPAPSVSTPDTTSGWMIAFVILLLLFVCAALAAGVWYLFLR